MVVMKFKLAFPLLKISFKPSFEKVISLNENNRKSFWSNNDGIKKWTMNTLEKLNRKSNKTSENISYMVDKKRCMCLPYALARLFLLQTDVAV